MNLFYLDNILFSQLNGLVGSSGFFDYVIVFFAEYLLYGIIVALLCFAFLNVRVSLFALGSGIIARFGVAELVRFFYDRPRPFEVVEGVRQLIQHSGGNSFPSGHAVFSFAIAASIAFYYPRVGGIFFVVAVGMGVARVAAGVHWPTDIIGGAIVGIMTAFLLRIFVQRFRLIS